MKRMAESRVKQVVFFGGFLLFVYLLYRVGWDVLTHDFKLLGWALLLILMLSGIKYLMSGGALAAAFFPEERQPWTSLFGYRVAGEAMNYLSIAGPLVSEPVKASLVRGVAFEPALASTLVETTINTIAASMVTVAGLAVFVLRYSTGSTLQFAGYGAMAILLALSFSLLYALRRRAPFLTWPWERVRRLGWRASPKAGEKLSLVEARIHRLSAERPAALGLIFLLSFAAQGLALLEIYAALVPLGITVSFSSVLVMEAFTKLAKAIFFFVPGRVGADEGSSAGIFALLGLAPAAGLTLALARRLRAIFWSGVGLGVLFAHSVKFEGSRAGVLDRRPAGNGVTNCFRACKGN